MVLGAKLHQYRSLPPVAISRISVKWAKITAQRLSGRKFRIVI